MLHDTYLIRINYCGQLFYTNINNTVLWKHLPIKECGNYILSLSNIYYIMIKEIFLLYFYFFAILFHTVNKN